MIDSITFEATRPIIAFVTVIAWGWLLWESRPLWPTFQRHRHQATWRASFITLTPYPFLLAIVAVGVMLWVARAGDDVPWGDKTRVVEWVIPIIFGMHLALAFSPQDEPALETSLTHPRPFAWTLGERWLLGFLMYGGLALVGELASLTVARQSLPLALVRWIPPMVALGSLGVWTTIRARNATFGAAVVMIFGAIFAVFGDALLPTDVLPAPFDSLQLFVWAIHSAPTTDSLGTTAYLINRALLMALGGLFLVSSARTLRDSEWLILGIKGQKKPNSSNETRFTSITETLITGANS